MTAKFDTFFCSLLPSGQTAELPHEGVKGIKRRLLSILYTTNKMDFQSHSREKPPSCPITGRKVVALLSEHLKEETFHCAWSNSVNP